MHEQPNNTNPIVKDGPGKAPAPSDTDAAPSTEKVGQRPQNEPAKPEPEKANS